MMRDGSKRVVSDDQADAVNNMKRCKVREARAIIAEELAYADWDAASSFTVESGARPGAETQAWWHENTPGNERSGTLRSLAYLRAYLRISGEMPLYACGLFLEQRRLWMDRSIMSRLVRDGFLAFAGEGKKEPWFEVTDK